MEYQKAAGVVIGECQTALDKVDAEKTQAFIELVTNVGKVFFIGVGRVKLELEAIAKRFVHLGIDAHIVGDINEPAMTERDVLIVGLGSGESLIPVAIAKKAKSLGGKIVHIGSNANSTLAPIIDLMIRIPVQTKLYLDDEIKSTQPMSSLFEQTLLLWGDAVAGMIVSQKKSAKIWRNTQRNGHAQYQCLHRLGRSDCAVHSYGLGTE